MFEWHVQLLEYFWSEGKISRSNQVLTWFIDWMVKNKQQKEEDEEKTLICKLQKRGWGYKRFMMGTKRGKRLIGTKNENIL